jgi:hypothetical protein
MRTNNQDRPIRCRWDGTQVVVDLGAADGSETLTLTIQEAGALAERLSTDLIRWMMAERYGTRDGDTTDVLGVALTFGEMSDLMNGLSNVAYIYEITGGFHSRLSERPDWLHEGF